MSRSRNQSDVEMGLISGSNAGIMQRLQSNLVSPVTEVCYEVGTRTKIMLKEAGKYATWGIVLGSVYGGLLALNFSNSKFWQGYCDILLTEAPTYHCTYEYCNEAKGFRLNCTLSDGHYSTERSDYPSDLLSDAAREGRADASLWLKDHAGKTIGWTMLTFAGVGALVGLGVGFFKKIPAEEQPLTVDITHADGPRLNSDEDRNGAEAAYRRLYG